MAANKPRATSADRNLVHLCWNASHVGICKVNNGGSRKTSSGLIGAGGLLRDSLGNWIKGFTINLDASSIAEAELWGIFYGINLAWNIGFKVVEIECDFSSAIGLLNNPIAQTHPFSILLPAVF